MKHLHRVRSKVEEPEEEDYEEADESEDDDDGDDTPDEAMEGETEFDAGTRILEKYAKKAKSPTKAIRAFCIHCMGGYVREVAKCSSTRCVLWPFRMGHNPFHGRAKGR